MQVFQDLVVTGPRTVLERLPDGLAARITPPWSRDPDAETKAREVGLGPDFLVYVREEDQDLPKASLFLTMEGQIWNVSNIVPVESDALSMTTYNAILREFEHLLRPVAEAHGLLVQVTSPDKPLEEFLSPGAATLLRRFALAANAATGSAHPSDFRRWAAFLIHVHRDGTKLYASDLERLLVMELKWPADTASKLALEYEFAQALLEAYDEA